MREFIGIIVEAEEKLVEKITSILKQRQIIEKSNESESGFQGKSGIVQAFLELVELEGDKSQYSEFTEMTLVMRIGDLNSKATSRRPFQQIFQWKETIEMYPNSLSLIIFTTVVILR